tara:strand:- start:6 stop:545 length:540 start_codon:yes stop_codon:yes gene_type:complete
MKSIYNFFKRCYFDFFIHGGWKPNTWPNGIRMAILRNKHRLIELLGGYIDGPNQEQNVSVKGVFDYGEITEGQKSVVEELLEQLKQDPKMSFVLDDEKVSSLKKQFKIEEIDRFDIEKSVFYQFAKQKNYYIPIQGWIKQGLGPDAIEYPIISTSMDIRDYDKMVYDLIQKGKDSATNT